MVVPSGFNFGPLDLSKRVFETAEPLERAAGDDEHQGGKAPAKGEKHVVKRNNFVPWELSRRDLDTKEGNSRFPSSKVLEEEKRRVKEKRKAMETLFEEASKDGAPSIRLQRFRKDERTQWNRLGAEKWNGRYLCFSRNELVNTSYADWLCRHIPQ